MPQEHPVGKEINAEYSSDSDETENNDSPKNSNTDRMRVIMQNFFNRLPTKLFDNELANTGDKEEEKKPTLISENIGKSPVKDLLSEIENTKSPVADNGNDRNEPHKGKINEDNEQLSKELGESFRKLKIEEFASNQIRLQDELPIKNGHKHFDIIHNEVEDRALMKCDGRKSEQKMPEYSPSKSRCSKTGEIFATENNSVPEASSNNYQRCMATNDNLKSNNEFTLKSVKFGGKYLGKPRYPRLDSTKSEPESDSRSTKSEPISYSCSAKSEPESYTRSTISEPKSYSRLTISEPKSYSRLTKSEPKSYSQLTISKPKGDSQIAEFEPEINSQSIKFDIETGKLVIGIETSKKFVSNSDLLSGGEVVYEDFADIFKNPNYYEDSVIIHDTSPSVWKTKSSGLRKSSSETFISVDSVSGGKVTDNSMKGVSLPTLFPLGPDSLYCMNKQLHLTGARFRKVLSFDKWIF